MNEYKEKIKMIWNEKHSVPPKYIVLIFVFLLLINYYFRYINLSVENVKVTKAKVIRCIPKPLSNLQFFEFEFSYNGERFYEKDGYYKDDIKDCNCFLENKFPVVFDSLDPNDCEIIFDEFWATRYGLDIKEFPCIYK